MGGAAQVVEYLGRYTNKVAISNHRIKRIDTDNNVTFEYKDYTDEGRKKTMTLPGEGIYQKIRTAHTAPTFLQDQALRLPEQLQTKRAGKRDTPTDEHTSSP